MRLRIFISHSTKTDFAQNYLDAVESSLADEFDVLLDQTGLQGGDDWREKIYKWMDQAHGAVVLLTQEALKSDFVPIELSVLSWRRCREPDFFLVPAFVGPINDEELSKGVIGQLALKTIQIIDGEQPAELAAKILTLLREQKSKRSTPRTAWERFEEYGERVLTEGRVSEKQIFEVYEMLRPHLTSDSHSLSSQCRGFFRLLVKSNILPIHSCQALRRLWDGGFQECRELLQLLAPCWVPEKLASPIATRALHKRERRAMRLDARDPLVVRLYICRSGCRSLSRSWPVCELSTPTEEDTVKDLTEQILEFLKPSHIRTGISSSFLRDQRRSPEEELCDQLKRRDEQNPPVPVFAVFPSGYIPDVDLLDAIRDKFPLLNIVVLTPSYAAEVRDDVASGFCELTSVGESAENDLVAEFYIASKDLC
ncbi:MAG: toll/interleukin-1 receptor domain-containing protein [Schlesneria sp.]